MGPLKGRVVAWFLALSSLVGIGLETPVGEVAEVVGGYEAKALVYCPVGIDAAGCERIVQTLTGDLFPGGVDVGYDGSAGTLVLSEVDLGEYAVFVVPALADDLDRRPYDLLRSPEVAEHLAASRIGRVAIWSGTPDQGDSNVEEKAQLLTSLARWAGGRAGEIGIVVLQDVSTDAEARYDWLSGFAPVEVKGSHGVSVHGEVLGLTTSATEILEVDGEAMEMRPQI